MKRTLAALTGAALLTIGLAAPASATNTNAPEIDIDQNPQCSSFEFTASIADPDFTDATYTVTADYVDSDTQQTVGETIVKTGSYTWGETISMSIDPANEYLLWTYRVDTRHNKVAAAQYGESPLNCLPPVVDPGEQPQKASSKTEWVAGEQACDATEVEWTRTVTRTPYVLNEDGSEWILGEPYDPARETEMRPVEDEDAVVCMTPIEDTATTTIPATPIEDTAVTEPTEEPTDEPTPDPSPTDATPAPAEPADESAEGAPELPVETAETVTEEPVAVVVDNHTPTPSKALGGPTAEQIEAYATDGTPELAQTGSNAGLLGGGAAVLTALGVGGVALRRKMRA